MPVTLPITVRSLSEAIGMKAGELLFKLDGPRRPPSSPSTRRIEPELAELLALEYGIELDIKRPHGRRGASSIEPRKAGRRPRTCVPRAPIVTIMGHVDHGKTSLLDKIRQSATSSATEAGGITQVIRAWRVEHDGKPITFLDTPGHEAFTKMRARGANVTDIAVIVVAADDGVMPQTEEAISHAKAAGVSIVVAINKVDMPNANLDKTRQQLYSLELLPDNMGGDVPVRRDQRRHRQGHRRAARAARRRRRTEGAEGQPEQAGHGHLPGGVPAARARACMATLLVQRRHAAHGRRRPVRRQPTAASGQMYDDLGRPIEEAGPSVPVRITGLDEVPNADDPFHVVDGPGHGPRDRREAQGQACRRPAGQAAQPRHAGDARAQTKITELKVILKADVRGSVEAIRKELEKLQHEEVRVRVLHAGIGGITESDVQLALTSPEDTLIVGFNVVPDDAALSSAEERGVQIREYDIIYNLTDDMKAALEGKLKPREEVVHLGRAVVRETFKISKVGTIAGCYVTQGDDRAVGQGPRHPRRRGHLPAGRTGRSAWTRSSASRTTSRRSARASSAA